MAKFKPGQKVEWKWKAGYVRGTVVESFTTTIRKTIKGTKVCRHGTEENPAYHLKSLKGVDVLKLESELFDGEEPWKKTK